MPDSMMNRINGGEGKMADNKENLEMKKELQL